MWVLGKKKKREGGVVHERENKGTCKEEKQ